MLETAKTYTIVLLLLAVLGLGIFAYMQRGGSDTAGIDQAIRDIQSVRAEQRAISNQLEVLGKDLGTIRSEISASREELASLRKQIADAQSRVSADYGLIVEGRNIVEGIQQRDKKP